MNHAVLEPLLVEEFELRADVDGQGPLAPADNDRPEEQMALVDQFPRERWPASSAPPIVRSAVEVSLSRRTASRSSSRSIRVLALDTV